MRSIDVGALQGSLETLCVCRASAAVQRHMAEAVHEGVCGADQWRRKGRRLCRTGGFDRGDGADVGDPPLPRGRQRVDTHLAPVSEDGLHRASEAAAAIAREHGMCPGGVARGKLAEPRLGGGSGMVHAEP